MFFSPFEQFELTLLKIYYIPLFGFEFPITTLTLFISIVCFGIMLTLMRSTNKMRIVARKRAQMALELLYKGILDTVIDQVGSKGRFFFPAFFTVFVFILSSNLVGLLPFGFTITSQLIVTFVIAISYFIAWIIIGIKTLKVEFLRIFLPRGIPAWLMPLLVVIEILSFLIRPLSLSIRLFANMLAGHILLFIFSTATLVLAQSAILLGLLPFSFIIIFSVLEVGIAFLQSYVMTILLAIYLNDSLHAH